MHEAADERNTYPCRPDGKANLLAFPSVRRMADILSQRCREPSWVRTSVASLERFRAMTGHSDLEVLLRQAIGRASRGRAGALALLLQHWLAIQKSRSLHLRWGRSSGFA